ncbi:uncharacterized protein LOC143351846 [Colletes latitarsis]|uniref:uncharacterized protein LOC143351846 n=1 Tax=Colletes latitarsis TaxID=2605962 RepID=UPI0040352329
MVALRNDTGEVNKTWKDALVKMLRGRFFFAVILANVILVGDGRTIENRIAKIDTAKTLDRGEDFTARKHKILKRNDHLGESCPYGSKEMCLIFSLSRIANVRVAVPDQRSQDRSLKTKMFDVGSRNTGNSQFDRRIKESNENVQDYSKEQIKSPSNVHCKAIRDVYIPEVKQNLPAFGCVLGNNTFIISSARFLQDRRRYLTINVNENTLNNIKYPQKVSRSNEVSIIPTLLVLNVANDYNGDYRIQMHTTTNEKSIDREEIDKKLSRK